MSGKPEAWKSESRDEDHVTESRKADYILVGGGLQSGLMALAIFHHQPHARVLIVERQDKLAGNHTWSFHASDIPAECSAWAEPLVEHRWPNYQIRVGGRKRTVQIPYRTCSSEHFARTIGALAESRDCRIQTHSTVVELTAETVRLDDGRQWHASVVIDNRGPVPMAAESFRGGFQKFWGFEFELDSEWPHDNPIVMDDQIDQADGFRFIYSLPMERKRVLVEDTRFSNSPLIDRDECLNKVLAYVDASGCRGARIVREEHGVLPMPTEGVLPGAGLPDLAGGYRGGWFHASTGYSFPLAIRVAETVATTPKHELPQALLQLSQQHASRARFARFLNRLLFDLVQPRTRYQIFRRFYRVLGEPSIARFYGHRFTLYDAIRVVVGIPPRGLRPIQFIRSYARR
jgi:lycopene beta-cyclase